MQKISETGIEKFRETIGSQGVVMNIRVETLNEGKRTYADIVRDEKSEGQLIRETDGSTLLTIRKDADLTAEELAEVFTKSGEILVEVYELDNN